MTKAGMWAAGWRCSWLAGCIMARSENLLQKPRAYLNKVVQREGSLWPNSVDGSKEMGLEETQSRNQGHPPEEGQCECGEKELKQHIQGNIICAANSNELDGLGSGKTRCQGGTGVSKSVQTMAVAQVSGRIICCGWRCSVQS